MDDESVEHLRDLASEAPIIRWVNNCISRALEERASDIHIEPFEDALRIRFRVDGILGESDNQPRRMAPAIVSRIKIMAKLDIAEKRIPQDGKIKIRLLGKELDLRVSTVPTVHGESVVLRILDRASVQFIELTQLGMPQELQDIFLNQVSQPHGIFLVTGPTGSGKTTTLYATLNFLNNVERKIITVEDPVEYQLEGINQIHVNPAIGLSFSSGLRTILRQDPDVIMVGEIQRQRNRGYSHSIFFNWSYGSFHTSY